MLKLNRQSLNWALKQALIKGDTDIFPGIFEFRAIDDRSSDILGWLSDEDVLDWDVRPSRRCLTPKHQFGFRISTQLDPADFLVFTALVYEVGVDIENRRVSKSDDVVHSYRFLPQSDGTMFDSDYGYHSYLKKCKELAALNYSWVVLADIADFFPRIYHHRIKNALTAATTKTNHAFALDNLLNGWSESYSYGIPVGPSASRLLAEVALDDVDRSLISEGWTFVRFSDDFRIFCNTKREAYERLAFLANVLFENHGLTLQQHKTRILPVEVFNHRYLSSDRELEITSLTKSFQQIAANLGLQSLYEPITWEGLTEEQKVQIANLNLGGLLDEQLEGEEIDIPVTRFLLRRLSQLGNRESLQVVMDNLEKLYPVFSHVVQYIGGLHGLTGAEKANAGGQLLAALDSSLVSHLEFHRMWLLSLFAQDSGFNNADRFVSICSRWPDHITNREAILCLGRSLQDSWFRTRKRNVFDFSPWERRAVLYGGSCLPPDERKHWYQSLESRLDPIEIAITQWARQNPM